MNLELKRFQLSRIGNHRDSNGRMHHFTNELLQDVADEFNRRPKGENNPNPAPLYIGHPAQCKTPPEPLGIVSKLEFTDGKLYALAYATTELVNLIRRGIYRHVSAGFDRMKYGGIRLNHIAFLNNPAVKGMEALNFAENSECFVTFEQEICFSEPEYPNESYKLDALARAYMLEHPETSYYNAVIACIRQTDY